MTTLKLRLGEGEVAMAGYTSAPPLEVHVLNEVSADKKTSRCTCGYEGTNGDVFYHVVRKAVEAIAP